MQISDVFSASVSKKLNLSCEEISEQNTTANNHCVDCKDYKQLLENIKEKISIVPKRKQIPILTLAPDSWTQQKIASYFNVKLYSVRKAASMKKEQGILPKVPRKKWHRLDDDVLNLVKQFYEDDEYSRMCPGAKEYKSVTTDGVKRKKQNRLLLVNIKELYLEFWKMYINNSQGNDKSKNTHWAFKIFFIKTKMGGYSN